jgi:hypothetical protein
MAKQTINLGTSELAGDGESIRSAFDKCNDNFTENYASIASIESDIATLDGSKIVYGDLSVTTASASGAGALSYNSSTGVFTFTPAASGFDGDYNSLTNKPTIPTVPTTVSSFTNDSGYLTSYTETDPVFTAWDKSTGISITESQISDLQSYLTSYTETNDLTSAVTWANVPDANITESSVTQHQAALTITESQISDLSHTSTGNFTFSNNGITTANAASNITIAINGATASDPPAFVSKQWSFDTDGSFNFHNPLDIPSLQASITATKVGQWDDAYGWGNHSTQGYLTSESGEADTVLTRQNTTGNFYITFVSDNNVSGPGSQESIYTSGNLQWGNGGSTFTVLGNISSSGATAGLSISGGTVDFTGTTLVDLGNGTIDFTGSTVTGLTITESQVSDLGTYVESDTTGITGADQVSNIVTLTQAEYDAIGTPNASTVYIIVG